MRRTVAALAVLVALVAAAPLQGDPAVSYELGAGGMLYRLLEGAYRELLPEGDEVPGDYRVLVLEVEAPAGGVSRFLVPGTEALEGEEDATLVYEESSDTVYLVWRDLEDGQESLRVASFREGLWGIVHEVAPEPAGLRRNPGLAVTRSTFGAVAEDGAPVRRERTVLHLVWWQDAGPGGEIAYASVVFVGGVLQEERVVSLTGLLADLEASSTSEVPIKYLRTPVVTPGFDSQTVVITVPDGASGRLATFQVRAFPVELGALADAVEDQVRAEAEEEQSSDPSSGAVPVTSEIVTYGSWLHPGMQEYLEAEIERLVEDNRVAPDPLAPEQLAAEARSRVVEVGAGAFRGYRDLVSPDARAQLVIFYGERNPFGPSHVLEISRLTARPLPPVPARTPRTFVSAGGSDVLVAWEGGKGIDYLRSVGGGWSDVQTLPVVEGRDVEESFGILERLVRRR